MTSPRTKTRPDVKWIPVIEGVPLKAVLQDLLLKVDVKDLVDAEEHSAMLIALASMLAKDPSLVADVFVMPKTYRSRVAGRGFPETDLRAAWLPDDACGVRTTPGGGGRGHPDRHHLRLSGQPSQ